MSELWKFLSLWLPKIHISIPKKGSTKECFKPSGQLHSFPMLVSSCLKSCMLASVLHKPRTYRCPSWIRKGSRTRDQTAPLRKERNSRKTSTCVSSTKLKPLTVWIITNYGKLLKKWEYQTILLISWEACMWVKKEQLEPCMEQLTSSGLSKEYNRAVCRHPVCLTYMLSTS